VKGEERMVGVNEYRVNMFIAGSGGPCIVMLHGEDGMKEGWKQWAGLLPLADTYRLIVPDLVGFGKSHYSGEMPDYAAQARMLHELLDVMKIDKASFAGYSWGGQVALEFALAWPQKVESLILVASTYDKAQLPKLAEIARPSLIIWAEDDLVTQLKGGYLLRDAIRTSRLEVLSPVAKDPRHDLTYAHRLLESRANEVLKLTRSFLASPSASTAEPPEMENELRGMALRHESKGPDDQPNSAGGQPAAR
jgi:pimeloyl-ACP methyl ester carboxylesterase